ADDGIRDGHVTGVQTCALPISSRASSPAADDVPKPRAAAEGEPRRTWHAPRVQSCARVAPRRVGAPAAPGPTLSRPTATAHAPPDRKSVGEGQRAYPGWRGMMF